MGRRQWRAPDRRARAAAAVAGQLEFDHRLTGIGARIDRLENRIDARFDRIEARVAKLETEAAVLKWMIGANIALTILVFGKLLIP